MKKVCFVTSARSDYGVLRWIMEAIKNSNDFELQIIATGGHLMHSQGYTVDQIVEDGFTIDKRIPIEIKEDSKVNIAQAMGKLSTNMASAFYELNPDYAAILGDRYELLAIANAAFLIGIPIIHFSGGDVTEGAIDDAVRNAVTMLSTYHFPGTEDSKKNIIRMTNDEKNVWAVGEPGLEAFFKESLLSREELAEDLGLDIKKEWVLFTFHAETREDEKYSLMVVKNCIEVLQEVENTQIVMTYSNLDFGGTMINEYLEKVAVSNPGKFVTIKSLGQKRYLSFMKQVSFMMGNSSSGIIEAPTLKVPVINIGKRQSGRYLCSNIVQANGDIVSLKEAIEKVKTISITDDYKYWGDGKTSEAVLKIMKDFLQ